MPITIGHTGAGAPYTLSTADRRQHLLINGSTGTGKSVLLSRMLAADFQSGEGVVLIDPHGSLARDAIALIPPRRARDLRYIDLSDQERPVGFSPIANVPRDRHAKVAEDTVATFVHMFGEDAVADRSRMLLRNAVRLTLHFNETFLIIPELLTDDEYRFEIVAQYRRSPDADPQVLKFWTHKFPNDDQKRRDDWVSPLVNKFDALLTPALCSVIAQKDSVDLRTVMDERRILIVNLAKGVIGELPANFFGSLIFSATATAAFTREVPKPGDQPLPQCHVYADEYRDFVNPSVVTIVAECRKYGMDLTLAGQSVTAVDPDIRRGILSNVGSVIAFRCGRDDSEIFQKHIVGQDDPYPIQTLPNYTAWARFIRVGESTQHIRLTMLPPLPPYADAEKLIQNSRTKFGTPRSVIERKLSRFLEGK